jgi:transcriptional regulator with PAS, ATPase and Fis domain
MAQPPVELIGSHPHMVEVRKHVARIARSEVGFVLLYGETGTGKGIVARMIHEQSKRAKAPFIDVNCAAIPGTLMESELFGHVKGAFTGAGATKPGLLSAANGGTLFLDEIPELELSLQSKLLTVLDSQQYRPVGAVKPLAANVRFVAATNKVLFHEVRAKRFRDDLYYRLLVVTINMPPLRTRGDDIFELTDYFLERLSRRYGRVVRGVEPSVRDVFRLYRWPGNVRQLQNVIERIFLLEDDDQILMKHIPPRILLELNRGYESNAPWLEEENMPTPVQPDLPSGPVDFHAEVAKLKRALLSKAFADSAGNVSGAARRLSLSRHAFRHYWAALEEPHRQPRRRRS